MTPESGRPNLSFPKTVESLALLPQKLSPNSHHLLTNLLMFEQKLADVIVQSWGSEEKPPVLTLRQSAKFISALCNEPVIVPEGYPCHQTFRMLAMIAVILGQPALSPEAIISNKRYWRYSLSVQDIWEIVFSARKVLEARPDHSLVTAYQEARETQRKNKQRFPQIVAEVSTNLGPITKSQGRVGKAILAVLRNRAAWPLPTAIPEAVLARSGEVSAKDIALKIAQSLAQGEFSWRAVFTQKELPVSLKSTLQEILKRKICARSLPYALVYLKFKGIPFFTRVYTLKDRKRHVYYHLPPISSEQLKTLIRNEEERATLENALRGILSPKMIEVGQEFLPIWTSLGKIIRLVVKTGKGLSAKDRKQILTALNAQRIKLMEKTSKKGKKMPSFWIATRQVEQAMKVIQSLLKSKVDSRTRK